MFFGETNSSPTNIVQGVEDTSDYGPFGIDSDSFLYPEDVATLGGPSTSDADIVEALVVARRRAKERGAKYTHRTQRAFDYYNNRYPDYGKEMWQSTKVAPTMFTTVEQFTSTVSRMLERSNDWIGMKNVTDKSAVLLDFLRPLMHKMLDSKAVGFGKVFRRGVKSALLSGMFHVLVLFQNDGEDLYRPTFDSNPETDLPDTGFLSMGGFDADVGNDKPSIPGKNKPRIRLELIHHDQVAVDHYTGGDIQRGGWKTYSQTFPKGYFKKMAPDYGYDMVAVEKAIDMHSHDDYVGLGGDGDAREADREDMIEDYRNVDDVKVTHFFGTLYDDATGDILVDTQYFVVLNDTAIIKAPEDVPFWEVEDPIVSAPLIEDPSNEQEGRSPLVMNLDMFQLEHELDNLMEDFYVANLLGMKEIDMDTLDDFDEDFREGLYPGRVIYTRKGQNPAAETIRLVPMTQTDPGFWNYFGVFQRNISVHNLLPDSQTGMPRTRGRTTNMEDARRAAEAGNVMAMVWEGLDDNFLSCLAQKVMYRILQYMPAEQWKEEVDKWASSFVSEGGQLTPAQQEWLGTLEEVSKWPPEVRWDKLASEFEMNIRVFSTLGDRQRMIEQATFFLQTGAQIPGFWELVEVREILRYLARAFDWAPDRVLKPEGLGPPQGIMPGYNPYQQAGERQPPSPQAPREGGPEHLVGPNYQGLAQSISTSPPFAPGTGGPGQPP